MSIFPWYETKIKMMNDYLFINLLDNIPADSLIKDPDKLFNGLTKQIIPCFGYGANLTEGNCSCTFAYKEKFNSCYCPDSGKNKFNS